MDSSDNNEWSSLEDYPNYQINREGQLRNTKTGTKIIPKTSPNKKYNYCQIEDRHGIMKTPRIDQLVAETFLPRKAKQTAVIVHLDGNINNCSADNLIWDDEEYYAKQYYLNTGIQKPKEYFIFYPLMEFPDSQYEINKMGQIRNKYTYKILTGGLASGGYRAHTLRINKKTVFRLAHLMVAKQFIPNPENKPLVNHIDEDKSNPCIDNLEWVTGAENVHHGTALHRGNLGRNKPVNEYNIQPELFTDIRHHEKSLLKC